MSESKHSSTLPSKSSSVVTIHVQDAKGYTRYSGVPEHALELCKENNSGAAGVAAKSIAGTLPSNVPGMHGLIQAAHEAFADELPLHLRPDDLYLAIVQQVAIQVASNPDKYRAKVGIQKPEGKEVIRVRHDGLSTADSIAKATPKWATVFPVFAEEINKRIKATDVTKAVQLQFSTTSSQDVLVRQIAFMDVLKSYFDYRVCTRCGKLLSWTCSSRTLTIASGPSAHARDSLACSRPSFFSGAASPTCTCTARRTTGRR